jgi:hypothetical protein
MFVFKKLVFGDLHSLLFVFVLFPYILTVNVQFHCIVLFSFLLRLFKAFALIKLFFVIRIPA